jgi:2-amino-4-hydroxy-6-hydroxymethyldihydropteridine diphosphokinase
MSRDFIVGLGSNLGEREQFLTQAVTRIAALPELRVRALSRVFESAALGPPQPRYLNAAVRVESALDADALLDRLLAIELELGRVRDVRWGPRVIDLDILWGAEAVHSERLTVPHAHLRERNFALGPLLDVAPELANEYAATLCALGGEPTLHGKLRFREQNTCEWVGADIV